MHRLRAWGRLLGYGLQYSVMGLAFLLLRLLPFEVRRHVAGALMRQAVWLYPPARKRGLASLSRAFPDMPAPARKALLQEMGRHMGMSLSEIHHNAEFAAYAQNAPVRGPGLEALRRAKEDGKGAIIVSGHYGQWEAIRHRLKAEGLETGAVYRPNANPFYEKRFLRNIEKGGRPILPKGASGTREMLRHLRKGGFVAIMIDQKYQPGTALPFLGHLAMTSTAPAEMALRYGLPLVPAYGLRGENGALDLVFEAPIPPSDPLTMTQAAQASLEARIHEDPSQWYWLHRRWDGVAQPTSAPQDAADTAANTPATDDR